MKRLFLALLMVLFLSLAVPQLRERSMPKYREAAAWIWVRIEGPLAPALDPWREMRTRSEMAWVVRELLLWRNRGFPPPSSDEIAYFMERSGMDPTGTDEWGSSYHFQIRPDSVFLRSPGPDLTLETDDDLVLGLRYRSPYRFRRPPR